MMNVLYIDYGNVVSDSYLYRYYGDFYRELKEIANVNLYQNVVYDINDVLSNFENIDCIIFGMGYFSRLGKEAYRKIEGLSDLKIPVVCYLHKPQKMLEEKLNFFKINNIDLLLDSQSTHKKHGEIAETKSYRAWFTATPEIYHPREDVSVEYDLGFIGATHGNNKVAGETMNIRDRMYDLLMVSKYNVYWKKHFGPEDRISIEDYASQINKCKIWLATTGPTLDVSPRYFEVMLSKTLLVCNDMPNEYGDVFKDGVNCVMFKNDLSDLIDKVDYYLNNEKERNLIVDRAYEMVKNNYTWKHMASNVLSKIEEIKNELSSNS